MFGDTILFLQSIMGLTFGLIALISKKRSASTNSLIYFLIVGCIYTFAECSRLKEITDYQQYIIADILTVSLAMALPVTAINYLNSLTNENKFEMKYLSMVLICIGIGFGASSAILYSVMGIDNATYYISSQIDKRTLLPAFNDRFYQIHFLITNRLFYIMAGFEALLVIYVCLRNLIHGDFSIKKVGSFIRNDRPVKFSVLNIQSLLMLLQTLVMSAQIVMGRVGLINHMVITYLISLLMAVFVFAISMVAFSSEGMELSRKNSSNPFGTGAVNSIQQSTYFPEESFDTLKVKFENAMKNERIFLDPDLTIQTMSISMETNRTYLSRLVNMMYKTDFRTYINNLRISYAKELIVMEPSASMEYIALKSGFKTLSQFNRKFKEIDGDTPRRWQLMQIKVRQE